MAVTKQSDLTSSAGNEHTLADTKVSELDQVTRLSKSYAEAVANEKRADGTNIILLLPDDNLISQGENVRQMFNTLLEQRPSDQQVLQSLSIHLNRMGQMYREAIYPAWVKTSSPSSTLGCGEAAQRACRCFVESFQRNKSVAAANALAEIYIMAGFYGTAMFWLTEADHIAIAIGDLQYTSSLRNQKSVLEAEAKIVDPLLSSSDVFPTEASAGLQLNLQATAVAIPSIITEPNTTPSPQNVPTNKSHSSNKIALAIVSIFGVLLPLSIAKIFYSNNFHSMTSYTPVTAGSSGQPSASPRAVTADTKPSGRSVGANMSVMPGERFPQTRRGYMQASDIQSWSYAGVRYAQNEIYARYGYPFESAKAAPIRRRFLNYSWFHPVSGRTEADVEAMFTPIERANQLLLAHRRTELTRAGLAIN